MRWLALAAWWMTCALTTGAQIAGAAGAEHALYKSLDGGVTWSPAGAGLAGAPRINSLEAAAGRLLAGTDAGIYGSDDGGRTWGKTAVTARTLRLATAGSTIYAGTQGEGLLASYDEGRTWSAVHGLGARNIRSLLAGDGQLVAGTDAEGVMISRDGGRMWAAQNAGLPPGRQIFALARRGGTLYAGLYAKGLFAWSESARQWMKVGEVKPLVLAAAGDTLVAGHNPGGVFWSRQPGATEWAPAMGAGKLPAPVWEMAASGQLVLAGVADGIFRSEDGGRRWQATSRGLPAGSTAVALLVRSDLILAGLVMPPGGGK